MAVKEADLRKMKSGIFLPRNLDNPNRVEIAGEIRSLAQRFSGAWVSGPGCRAPEVLLEP
jgi:hypothetical protein